MREDGEKVVHIYDGIEEQDNQLPRWWLYILYASIVFAVAYWFHYQVFRSGPSSVTAYRVAKAERAAAEAKRAANVSPERLEAMAQDPTVRAKGQEIYTQTCVPCHGPAGGGIIGPNLTDDHWLHGGGPKAILASVRTGWPEKGMPGWGAPLGEERVQAVTAYLLSIKGSNAPGKPPQGEREAPSAPTPATTRAAMP
jgi:cytochrome c oxidase cbb3-type subunit 3